ncbi:MAG: hypothetical protein NWF05_08130 [Candidatus Bathyarchaeota archaeon]|nr:hypothetical protein [Candidatus Bathyarchaeota archaeon]
MTEKNAVSTIKDDLLVDLTFHNVSTSLLSEFAEKIVKPYYGGNLTAAFHDLVFKALAEQNFVLSHITHIRTQETLAKQTEGHRFRKT